MNKIKNYFIEIGRLFKTNGKHLAFIIVATMLISAMIFSPSESESSDRSVVAPIASSPVASSGDTSAADAAITTTTTAAPTTTTTTAAPITKYSAGMYKIGVDMPAGEYVAYCDGWSGYVAISSDSNQDNIIGNEIFYEQIYIQVVEGQFLKLSDCYAIPKSMATAYKDAFNSELYGCTLEVGRDIPSGEYKIEAISGDGYWCIYNKPIGNGYDIISNDIISGSSYITVKNGQYLHVSDIKIIK